MMTKPVFLLLMTVLLSACGQKGPLYLPDEVVVQEVQATPAPSPGKDQE